MVRDALVTLESSGRLALREMRQLLDVLRGDDEPEAAPSLPQPGVNDLDRLVAESRVAGLPTEFSVRGPQRPLPPTVGLTVFRIAQEALTNTRKYAGDAGDARASVQLTYHQDRVIIEVRDDGGGTHHRRRGRRQRTQADTASSACANASPCTAAPSPSARRPTGGSP